MKNTKIILFAPWDKFQPPARKRHKRLMELRGTIQEHNQRMRRARQLYIRFCSRAIIYDHTGFTLRFCAARMAESGLYSRSNPPKQIRCSILRKLWKMDPMFNGHWKGWQKFLEHYGFDLNSWNRKVA